MAGLPTNIHLPGEIHDTGKLAIVKECINGTVKYMAYLVISSLPMNLLRQQGEALKWGRARQGLLPDFRLRLPTPRGKTDQLAELTFFSARVSRFPRAEIGK